MSTTTRYDRRITGGAAVFGGLLSLVMIALYFVYSGPPPQANVLTRNLITLATFTAYLVFAVGLGRLLRTDGDGDAGMAGELAVAALKTYVTVTLVATSLAFGSLHASWVAGALAGAAYSLATYVRGFVSDAVVAHATTNAMLAAWVVAFQRWALW